MAKTWSNHRDYYWYDITNFRNKIYSSLKSLDLWKKEVCQEKEKKTRTWAGAKLLAWPVPKCDVRRNDDDQARRNKNHNKNNNNNKTTTTTTTTRIQFTVCLLEPHSFAHIVFIISVGSAIAVSLLLLLLALLYFQCNIWFQYHSKILQRVLATVPIYQKTFSQSIRFDRNAHGTV